MWKRRLPYRNIQSGTYQGAVKLLSVRLIAVVLLVSAPVVARAGVFSFVSGLFSSNTVKASLPYDNVQTIDLLQADVTPNSEFSRGGAEVVIVDNALLSESSPLVDEENIHRPESDQISRYVVHEGDTLSGIANMFNVSVNTILWTNSLKSSQALKEGQVLVILPISGVRHTVKSGDTIESIAKKYKGDVGDIKSYNSITGGVLAVGSLVIIPDGEMAASPVKAAPKSLTGLQVGVSTSVASGYYTKPINGVKTQGIHGFNGVDFGASVGTPIVASASGDVVIAKSGGAWNGGYGNYVVIAHGNGTQTLYAHASSVLVSPGQHVSQGQVIAYSGNSGKTTGPHLHFEIRGAKNPF